jgi:GT2 family glycosyltransferase
VVVVDNASTDGSVEMVRERFPRAQVLAMSRNEGFGVALNRAIAEVPGDPILLLNNDVECEPRFIERMVEALEPDVEMVAGVLVQHRAPGLIDSAGVVADRRTLMAFDYLHGKPVRVAEKAPPPLGPTGGAAMYRRRAFESVGGFDERMFLYYEDLDLALRMRSAGARCALAREARASHLYSATLRGRVGEKYARTGWSRAYMLRRYGVMRNPINAIRTTASEAAVCAGQLFLDRTTRGIAGRLSGWRDAAGLEGRRLPDVGLMAAPIGPSLRTRVGTRDRGSLGASPD